MQQRHLFEKVAQDWGYSNPNGSLESIVEQVISAPKDNMVLRVYMVWNGTVLFTMLPIPIANLKGYNGQKNKRTLKLNCTPNFRYSLKFGGAFLLAKYSS